MIPRFAPTAGWGEILAFQMDLLGPDGRGTGSVAAEFEQEFARYIGCEHALFVPSGRVALWLILEALGYPPGSEVILPGFTFFAIPAVVQLAGLKPVYADVDPATYELTPESMQAVMTEKTRAVVPTHLFGRTCDMKRLRDLCGAKGIDLIEDCAQSLGAGTAGAMSGSVGRAAYFTFGITKNLTTFGGGMVVTREKAIHEKVAGAISTFHAPQRSRLAREGMTALAMRTATQRAIFTLSLAPLLRITDSNGPDLVQRVFDEPPSAITMETLRSIRWRPTDAQARAGLRQMRTLSGKNEARRQRGRELREKLQAVGCSGIPAPAGSGDDHIFVSFAITRPDRYGFARRLRKLGVDVATGFMSNCAGLPELGGKPGLCPNAARVADEIIHLPLYPELSSADLQRIADAVAAAGRT